MWAEIVKAVVPESGQASGAGKTNTSLLNDWQTYQNNADVDIEGGASTSAQALYENFASSTVGKFASSAFKDVFASASGNISTAQETVSNTFGLSARQRWMYFIGLLAAGLFFLSIAIFVFLPMLVLTPSKFATSFTIGCMCIMSSFIVLRGWKQQLANLTSKERLPFTGGYLASVFGTLYVSLWLHSYILSVFFSAAQVLALCYFVSSFLPGGTAGMKLLLSTCGQGVQQLFKALFSK
mmetsp:Transcript_10596/g.26859  ORF Transcript_10596/g.26859 Transcript_10596/m.26859 type:complete len:239 (-) Transcript_10596:111-827(-)